jgi:hypothetical protein
LAPTAICSLISLTSGRLTPPSRGSRHLNDARKASTAAAAAGMTATTSLARDCIGTWLVDSDVILALIFFAIARSRSG